MVAQDEMTDPILHNAGRESTIVSDVLQKILLQQRIEVKRRATQKSLDRLRAEVVESPPCRPFAAALRDHMPAFIAELKKASPSQGLLRADYRPAAMARSYASGGAACLSVLTNAAFKGEDKHLQLVRSTTHLPLLRKDFIISEYQVYETRLLGADAMLLIVACLDPQMLARLYRLGRELGLDVLVEVHDSAELEIALQIDAEMIGVNNRNLRNFEVSLDTGAGLLKELMRCKPSALRIAESGICAAADLRHMQDAGAQAFLIGETFMRAADPGKMLRTFIDACQPDGRASSISQ